MATTKVYIPNFELTKLKTSSKGNKYRLRTPKAEVKINESTKELIQFVSDNQGKKFSQIVNQFSQEKSYSTESINKILDTLFEKNVLVHKQIVQDDYKNWKKEGLSRNEMDQLWFRRKLIDTDKYSRFFNKLRFIFSKPFVIGVLVTFFVLDIYFLYSLFFSDWKIVLKYYNSYDYLFIFPLGWMMILFHELGHTVATKVNGLSMPKGIGIGLYYFMIVFYADTHETWNLPRRKRAVVSIAGIYWNIIALVFLIPACFVTKSAALKDFILLVHISAISIFNPFLKMDGYWLLTDLLGVVNLHKKVRKYFKSFFWEQEKDAGELSDPFEGYPDRVKYSVVIYGLLYFLFLGAFLCFFLYKAGLIASSFEAEVLGGFMDIIGAKAGSRGNIARNINYLIRNLAILTGAFMLTVTGARRIFSFLLETREDK